MMNEIITPMTKGKEKEMHILEFVVNDVLFGVDVMRVQEILQPKEITATPYTEEAVLGMLNIRNTIYMVYDLNFMLFKKKGQVSDNSYFIVSGNEKEHSAFLIDDVRNIKNFERSNIILPSAVLKQDDQLSIVGIIKFENGDVVSLLDLEELIKQYV